jgi:hypothetical protein
MSKGLQPLPRSLRAPVHWVSSPPPLLVLFPGSHRTLVLPLLCRCPAKFVLRKMSPMRGKHRECGPSVWTYCFQHSLVRLRFWRERTSHSSVVFPTSSQARRPAAIWCAVEVVKSFPSCEHETTAPCSSNIQDLACRSICDVSFDCCSRKCKSSCHDCKHLSRPEGQDSCKRVIRNTHVPHQCDRPLLCGHSCPDKCAPGHECGSCKQERVKICIHAEKSRAKCCDVRKPCRSFFQVPQASAS